MSLNLDKKKSVVTRVKSVLQDSTTVVIAEYQGVTVNVLNVARKQARESNVYLHVLKNTLAKKSVEGTKFEALAAKMQGALIYSASKDPVGAAKVLNDFAKASNSIKIIDGMYEHKLLGESGVKHLATLPSREQLLSMLLGTMMQVPASFARALVAVRDKKQGEQAN